MKKVDSVNSDFGLLRDVTQEKMHLPVWDCVEMDLLNEPLETSNVVSLDVWKKFDLDIPLDPLGDPFDVEFDYCHPSNEGDHITPSREIRHHDCMWAGLCISKEHNSSLVSRIEPQISRKVPAGRSLLIRKIQSQIQQTQNQAQGPQNEPKEPQNEPRGTEKQPRSPEKPKGPEQPKGPQQPKESQDQGSQNLPQYQHHKQKCLDSDGDSVRPDTPESSEEDDFVPLVFRHDQISINERLSECLSESAINAAPISVVTGQQLVRTPIKRIENEIIVKEETDVRYTLSDHCYHLTKLDNLGVQTPSDSGETGASSDTEEEIDVVSYEKPTGRQQIVLPTYPSPADRTQLQYTVKSAFKEKPSRPRGRPPLASNTRKRAATAAPSTQAKRSKRPKTHKKRCNKYTDIDDIPLPQTNGIKCIPPSRSSSDDEPDTGKRSMHNNMERQRRVDLRKAFEDLRLLVPEVARNEKAPKVSILRQAASYCDKITKSDEANTRLVTELESQQEMFRARLSELRKDFQLVMKHIRDSKKAGQH